MAPVSGADSRAAEAPSPDTEPASTDSTATGRALLERVRAREPEALEAFFEAHFDRIYRLVHRLLGERAIAEDVTQDVFLKAYRAIDRLDVDRDPGPWLTAIAYNACRDVWRSGAHRMARRSASIEDDAGVRARLTTGANDPERDALNAERERRVRDALERLPDDLRTAVLLYDYRDLSHQEIADLLGIQHAAARKRYSRALGMLAKMLEEKDS